MGEACIRGNASYGDGVYKSTDAGKTWTHLGLETTRQIGRLQVHPTNPDIAFVAALGDAWGPHPDRGVYRTKDGGRTWQKVLFRSENAGAIDLGAGSGQPRTWSTPPRWSCGATHGDSAAPGPAPPSSSQPTAATRGPI